MINFGSISVRNKHKKNCLFIWISPPLLIPWWESLKAHVCPLSYSTYLYPHSLQSDAFLTSSYADDFTVSCSNSNVDQMAESLSAYSPIIEEWADERGLAISAPKSTITLFTPQFAQSNTHTQVTLNISILPLEKTSCILRVTFVQDHLSLISSQYVARALQSNNPSHSVVTYLSGSRNRIFFLQNFVYYIIILKYYFALFFLLEKKEICITNELIVYELLLIKMNIKVLSIIYERGSVVLLVKNIKWEWN